MPVLLLGLFNRTNDTIHIGAPTHQVGATVFAIAPDPLPGPAGAAGMYDSGHGADLELTFAATVAGHPGVTLTIDIWIQGNTFQKLFVESSDPANFPIQGSYTLDTPPDNFGCVISVG